MINENINKSVSNTKRKNAKKKLFLSFIGMVAVILAFGILLSTLGGSGIERKSKGYRSPKAAMEAFTKHVAKGNLDKALQGFSYDEQAKNISFVKELEQMQVWMPYSMDAPEYEEYNAINEAAYAVKAANQIKMFCYSLSPLDKLETPFDGGMIMQMDGAPYDAAGIQERLSPEKLKDLSLVRTDKVKGSDQKGSRVSGSEETAAYTALYKMGKNYYKGSFVLDNYEGKWKIRSLALNSDSPYGAVVQTTEKEYKKGIE